jgi:uncharacterized protein (TIGR03083 family)
MADTPERLDKASLLDAIHRQRTELEATIEPLTDDQLLASPAGGWSIVDHLAHITAWEQSIVALLQSKSRHVGLGVDKATYETHDVDAVNKEIFDRNHHRPIGDILDEFRRSHLQLLDVLDGLTDEELLQPYSHFLPEEPGDETGEPIIGWIAGNSYHHYIEHLPVIRMLARS